MECNSNSSKDLEEAGREGRREKGVHTPTVHNFVIVICSVRKRKL
jgi:hypothetical protein